MRTIRRRIAKSGAIYFVDMIDNSRNYFKVIKHFSGIGILSKNLENQEVSYRESGTDLSNISEMDFELQYCPEFQENDEIILEFLDLGLLLHLEA